MTEPLANAGSSSFLDSLGDRGWRRAEPRTSIAVAGAGCALGVLGVLLIAGDTGVDDTGGDFNKVPGIILSALVVAAGFFVLANTRRGAVATAGTVAATLGVPSLMFFLTFDQDSFPPYSTEGILIVSTIVWLASYAIGPARGRPFFLGSGLIGVWFTILQLTENVFDSPFEAIGLLGRASSSTTFDPDTGESIETGGGFGETSFDAPDPATIGMLSLGLGLAFLLVGRWLDRKGRYGVATPFAVAALPCLAVGVLGLSEDLEAAGSGLLMVLIGVGLAYSGATVWRRFTTWIGGATTAVGAGVFLSDMSDDITIQGMLFIAAGIGLVFAGHAIAAALHEPDEMEVTYALVAVDSGPLPPPATPGPGPLPPPTPTTPPQAWATPRPFDPGRWAPQEPPAPPAPPGAPEADDPPIPPPPPA